MSKDLEILVQNMQNDNVSEEEIASVIQLSEKNRKRKKDPPNPHGIPENDYKRIRKSLRKEYGFIPFRRKKRSGELEDDIKSQYDFEISQREELPDYAYKPRKKNI